MKKVSYSASHVGQLALAQLRMLTHPLALLCSAQNGVPVEQMERRATPMDNANLVLELLCLIDKTVFPTLQVRRKERVKMGGMRLVSEDGACCTGE